MNRETRTFIWGMMLLIVCGVGAAIHVVNLINGSFDYGWDWVLFAFSAVGAILGGVNIAKTTD